MDEQIGRTVWHGRIGDVPLRVDLMPSGRIAATWAIRGNERRATVDTIPQLEQRVLFQLLLGAGPGADVIAKEVTAAVEQGSVGLPDPTQAPSNPRRRKRPARRPGPPRSRRRR